MVCLGESLRLPSVKLDFVSIGRILSASYVQWTTVQGIAAVCLGTVSNPATWGVGAGSGHHPRLWRFRLWLARLVAPADENSFLDRWDVTDDAKRLALSWDRGYIQSVEWNPKCANCGMYTPMDAHCRECGAIERSIEDRMDMLERNVRNAMQRLDHAKRYRDNKR
jgi:hypothetical protein